MTKEIQVSIRFPEEVLARVEAYRERLYREEKIDMGRAAALRALVEIGLKTTEIKLKTKR